jgi:hypothetical protein
MNDSANGYTHAAWRLTKFCIALLFLFTVGLVHAQTAPGWVADLARAFPASDWVAVQGTGADRAAAESAAMNALARAFKTDVASLTQASQRMSQIVTDAAGKQSITFNESRNLAAEVTTASQVRGLIGVQTDLYQAPDGTCYVNARMNRRECAARYSAMIQENGRVIARLMNLAAGMPSGFDAYSALNYAYNLAVPTDNFQNILEVLDPRTVSQKPSYGSADAIKVLLQNAARSIVIRVMVSGDTGDRITRSFTQFFSACGFRTTRSGASTYLFNASLELENADFGTNQRYQDVRYALNVYAEDAEGIEVFSFSGEGRASHATESEARQLALRKVEASIGEEDFAAAFNAYLSALLE